MIPIVWNISEMPQLIFPWKVAGNLPENATPLQPYQYHTQL